MRVRTLVLSLLVASAAPIGAAMADEAAAPPQPEDEAAEGHGHGGPGGIELFERKPNTLPFGPVLVNFAILVTAIILLVRKPLARYLVARHRAIQDGLDEAQALKARAEERAREYDLRLQRFQAEMDELIAEYLNAGRAERGRLLAAAEEKAGRMRREAEFLVSQEVKQVRLDLRRRMVERSARMAEERLRSRVTPTDQQRLADEYLAVLAKATTEPSSEAA